MNNFISHVFKFSVGSKRIIKKLDNPFKNNYLGKVIFDKTYRKNREETWFDAVIRIIEGNLSIYLSHMLSNNLCVNMNELENMGLKMAICMGKMQMIPGGRQVKNMDVDLINKKGSMMLNNCAAISTSGSLTESALTMFKYLHSQTGVGFDTLWNGNLYPINHKYIVNEEVNNEEVIINGILSAYEYGLGLPIYKRFGNMYLKSLNDDLIEYCENYLKNMIKVRLVADVMNRLGVYCQNRFSRNAQIMIGSPYNDHFLNLKNTKINPERSKISWSSNNSVVFCENKDLKMIPKIVDLIRSNGEPGLVNAINMREYGRYGKEFEKVEIDGKIYTLDVNEPSAYLINPCGEICLEPYELCNLITTVPKNCDGVDEWYKSLKYATIFSSNVSLLMSEFPKTNEVIVRNRRIGVSISGLADIFDNNHLTDVIKMLKMGYKIIRKENKIFSMKTGVPPAIKVTTIKPDGNLSLLLGVSPGIHFQPFDKYCIRRVRMNKKNSYNKVLISDGIPYENADDNDQQYVFEFPYSSISRSVRDVSVWEQIQYSIITQKFWSDNNISFTARFNENESKYLEKIVSMTIPFIKTISLLPQETKGSYTQMPYEEITKDEYMKRMKIFK